MPAKKCPCIKFQKNKALFLELFYETKSNQTK